MINVRKNQGFITIGIAALVVAGMSVSYVYNNYQSEDIEASPGSTTHSVTVQNNLSELVQYVLTSTNHQTGKSSKDLDITIEPNSSMDLPRFIAEAIAKEHKSITGLATTREGERAVCNISALDSDVLHIISSEDDVTCGVYVE